MGLAVKSDLSCTSYLTWTRSGLLLFQWFRLSLRRHQSTPPFFLRGKLVFNRGSSLGLNTNESDLGLKSKYLPKSQCFSDVLPIGNHSASPYYVLTVAFCQQYRLHIRRIKCWGTPISFGTTHGSSWSTVKGITVVYTTHTEILRCIPVTGGYLQYDLLESSSF